MLLDDGLEPEWVDCRIGSLENTVYCEEVHGHVDCRIGSLENDWIVKHYPDVC